jgi:hypothetical protein
MRKKDYFILSVIGGLLALSVPIVFAADQMKSTVHIVGSSNAQIASQFDQLFTVYIGDNLSGVTTPMKSAYFTVTGVYTGSGTLGLELNGDGSTLQTFNLPNVGSTPTPFQILYQDTTGKVNPISAGTYAYTLNAIPSGVTISGFGAVLDTTHRYVPTSCDDGPSTNEKIKTTEHFVAGLTSQISTNQNIPFSLYIGDNLSGVTSPMKSAYFTVTGVYTGGGTLGLQLDSDGSTLQTFTLPNTGAIPQSFTFLYKDTSGKISPTSAGTYSYILNAIPSGVTVSGFGVTGVTTYRYKPPACVTGLPATGELTSAVFDSTGSADGPSYNSILWKGTRPGVSKVRFQLATSDSSSGPWSFIGGATCSSGDWYDTTDPDAPAELTCAPTNHDNQRYFRYKIQLCSSADCATSGSDNPSVDDVVVNWSP